MNLRRRQEQNPLRVFTAAVAVAVAAASLVGVAHANSLQSHQGSAFQSVSLDSASLQQAAGWSASASASTSTSTSASYNSSKRSVGNDSRTAAKACNTNSIGSTSFTSFNTKAGSNQWFQGSYGFPTVGNNAKKRFGGALKASYAADDDFFRSTISLGSEAELYFHQNNGGADTAGTAGTADTTDEQARKQWGNNSSNNNNNNNNKANGLPSLWKSPFQIFRSSMQQQSQQEQQSQTNVATTATSSSSPVREKFDVLFHELFELTSKIQPKPIDFNKSTVEEPSKTISIIPATEITSAMPALATTTTSTATTTAPRKTTPVSVPTPTPYQKKFFYATMKNLIKKTFVPGYAPHDESQLHSHVEESLYQEHVEQEAQGLNLRFELEAGRKLPPKNSIPDLLGNLQSEMQELAASLNPFDSIVEKAKSMVNGDETKGTTGGGNNDNNNNDDDDDDTKFDMAQRIESTKAAVIGALSGGIAVSPVTFLHDVVLKIGTTNGFSQWEFTTDMAAVQAALFALTYRYAIRENDNNPMLNQGVLGAFVLTRTLSNVQVSASCSAVPLSCGEPLGYLDWNMISQIAINGVESAVLFGAAALAIEFAFSKGFLTKFK